MEQAVEIGLQGLAITDHHAISGFYTAQDWLESANSRRQEADRLPKLWTGVEITALLLDTEVHMLGYGFDPAHEAIEVYLQGDRPQGEAALAQSAIGALHEAGGLAVLAHPERYRRPARELIPVAAELGIDGVETYYAYNNPKPWKPSDRETQQVADLAQRHALYSTCGTDTHGHSLLQRL
jgi:predicted metal-dependent phosphoesterase TrpH